MTCRGFEAVCSNNEARQYFADKGLTYDDITEGDILILSMMLKKEIEKLREENTNGKINT